MRTTVKLDRDVVEVARSLAATEGISLGAAISALARRGIAGTPGTRSTGKEETTRFPTFSVSEDAPQFGTEEVRQALDDE
jgi:hypothetical protein